MTGSRLKYFPHFSKIMHIPSTPHLPKLNIRRVLVFQQPFEFQIKCDERSRNIYFKKMEEKEKQHGGGVPTKNHLFSNSVLRVRNFHLISVPSHRLWELKRGRKLVAHFQKAYRSKNAMNNLQKSRRWDKMENEF